MSQRDQLALDALARALRVRSKLGVPLDEAISPIDVAERLGIEVRLVDIPSMEGMYVSSPSPTIILSSLRFSGRRNFTCGHEIGHHIYGHGEQFDELISEKTNLRSRDPKEFCADCFSAFLLMPKATIDNGMTKRGLKSETLRPIDVYKMASWLGVGYSTFVSHLYFGLRLISLEKARSLWKVEPGNIRSERLGISTASQLYIVDINWKGRAADCEVGDYLIFPSGSRVEGKSLEIKSDQSDSLVIQATTSGIARVSVEQLGWAIFVRVSRAGYIGRACFRFEEESTE